LERSKKFLGFRRAVERIPRFGGLALRKKPEIFGGTGGRNNRGRQKKTEKNNEQEKGVQKTFAGRDKSRGGAHQFLPKKNAQPLNKKKKKGPQGTPKKKRENTKRGKWIQRPVPQRGNRSSRNNLSKRSTVPSDHGKKQKKRAKEPPGKGPKRKEIKTKGGGGVKRGRTASSHRNGPDP